MTRALAILIALLASAQCVQAQEKPMRERIEWCNIWVTGANQDDLPRVLLIGDSIVMGYSPVVEKQLKGKAHCARLATSKCAGDPAFLAEVELLLTQYRFRVIHFNNGLHGGAYTAEQYKAGLRDLIALFRKHAKGATLIWATTTPVRKRGHLGQFAAGTKRVKERNAIAAALIAGTDILINDLFALVAPHPHYAGPDGTHFSPAGRAAQGNHVAATILKHLAAPQKGNRSTTLRRSP